FEFHGMLDVASGPRSYRRGKMPSAMQPQCSRRRSGRMRSQTRGWMVTRTWFAFTLLGGLAACSASSPQTDSPTYYRHVKALVQWKGVGCPRRGGIAPFGLNTLDNLLAHRDQVRSAVATRAMPPWPPAKGCSEYLADRSLADDQVALITQWIDSGAPAG